MNSAIEFHDSEVQSIESDGDAVRILFSSAYVHRSTGKPGVDSGEGFSQPAELVFSNAQCSGPAAGCAGNISEGTVLVDGRSLGLLPLPYSASGNISAKIVFVSGAEISISARSLECFPTGRPTFVEAYGA